jgi:sec-independent protein translocase protein TatC
MSDALEPSASSIDAVARDDLTPRPIPGALPTSGPQPPRDGDGTDGSVMSLVDHLAELRRRVAISIAAIAVGGVLGFYFAPQIIKLLLDPLPNKRVVFLTLSGGFLLYFKIAVIVGFLIGLPVILYELWAFVAPGLTERERRTALPWLPFAVVFFLVGTIVAYVTLPYAVAFLVSFQIPGSVDFFPSAEAYFGFVTLIFIVFGAVMEFPILLILLAKLGVVDRDRLRGSRRYVFLGIVVFSVVITPGGDPISPLVMSAVMYVLYEFTIFMLGRSSRLEPSDA